MEVTLHDLIESIKKDGVETAEKRAGEIESAAEKKAEEILQAAKKQADSIIAAAEHEAAMKEQSSIALISQASRDLLISLKKSITAVFEAVLVRNSKESLADAKLLSEIIATAVKADLLEGESGVLEIDDKLIQKVEKELKNQLSAELLATVELKPVKGVSGFKLSDKQGAGYFHITPAVLAEMLGTFLSPELSDLITVASESGE